LITARLDSEKYLMFSQVRENYGENGGAAEGRAGKCPVGKIQFA
jgi:hypothetical protein